MFIYIRSVAYIWEPGFLPRDVFRRGGYGGAAPPWTSEIYDFQGTLKNISPPPGQIHEYVPVSISRKVDIFHILH